jgi:hypothetical protein
MAGVLDGEEPPFDPDYVIEDIPADPSNIEKFRLLIAEVVADPAFMESHPQLGPVLKLAFVDGAAQVKSPVSASSCP